MRKKRKLILKVSLLLLAAVNMVSAQPNLNQEALPDREVSEETWKERTQEMNYGQRKSPDPEPDTDEKMPELNAPSEPFFNLEALSPVILTLVIIIIATLIIYLLVQHFSDGDLRAKARDANKTVDLQKVEEKLESTDINSLLKHAIEKGDHRTALRLYYLLLLQQMSLNGLIRWSKEKTNFEYLIELNDNELAHDFKHLTIAYERVWYGDRNLNAMRFRQLEPAFQKLLVRIR